MMIAEILKKFLIETVLSDDTIAEVVAVETDVVAVILY